MSIVQMPKGLEVKVEKDLNSLMQQSTAFTIIEDKEGFDDAAALMGIVKSRIKRLKELEKSILQPIKDAVKEGSNKFKMLSEPFVKMESQLRYALNEYVQKEAREAERKLREQRRREAEEAKKAAAMQEESNATAPEPPPVPPAPIAAPDLNVRTESGYTYTKKRWVFEVTDEAKIPKKYLMVNEKLINQEIRSGKRKIAGIKIYQKTEIANR